MVIKIKHITEDMVNNNPDKIFLFGDNVKRIGRGGLAAICRGKSNCIGICTKWIVTQ